MYDAPFFFVDEHGNPAAWTPAKYLTKDWTYLFPPSHRLAGVQSYNTMEPMWRDLLRLFVRCDYDFQRFNTRINHSVTDLRLPFQGSHVRMTNGWIYSGGTFDGQIHPGIDFNDKPMKKYIYPDHPARTNFKVVAPSDGTIVGWDREKHLTIEHSVQGTPRYRTIYNMVRNVPVKEARRVLILGRFVRAGDVIGEVWDPPENEIHLHFGLAVSHTVRPTWGPNLAQLSSALEDRGIELDQGQIDGVLRKWSDYPWQRTEWFFVDPFGLYDVSRSWSANYGPVGRGFYYPVPRGAGTYAFRDEAVGGDPGGDRIPLFAASQALRDNLSVQPLSMGTLAAVLE